MNLRDPKTQVLVVVAILFAASFYLWFVKIFAPLNEQITAKETQKNSIMAQLYEVEKTAATLVDLEKEYSDLELRYKRVALLLPEAKEDEAFLNHLHAAAQLTGSTVKKVTPLGTTPSEFYETNKYAIEVSSTYHGLGKFLSKVANFPFIVNLSDINLKSPSTSLMMMTGDSSKEAEPVTATFILLTYNVKQGLSQ